MITKIKNLFTKLENEESKIELNNDDINLTCAALLIELVYADKIMNPEEVLSLRASLTKVYLLDKETIDELIKNGEQAVNDSTSLYEYTKPLNLFLNYQDKLTLIGNMWKLAYADGNVDKFEEFLIRKISDLLHIEHSDFINQKINNR